MYPYLIPSQFFAYHTLKCLSELLKKLNWIGDFDQKIKLLLSDLYNILFDPNIKSNTETLITSQDEKYGFIYSYEINGIGNRNLMDDSSIPSLLSLPYLCPNKISINDTIYQNTRQFILSKSNPLFYQGGTLQGKYSKLFRMKICFSFQVLVGDVLDMDWHGQLELSYVV